jgi:putative transposase
MARPCALSSRAPSFHVTFLGERREPIFADDDDRLAMLAVVEQAMSRFDAQVLAYCLNGNHCTRYCTGGRPTCRG